MAIYGANTIKSNEAEEPQISPKRPDRAGKRMVAGYLDPDAFRDFKILVAENDSTTDAMVKKAVALLFENYGRKPPRSLTNRLKNLGL